MTTNYYAVESEDVGYYEGIHLAQTAGGWEPSIQWHGDGCSCRCDMQEHHYRNFDEFCQFVNSDEVIVKDEYGQVYNSKEFLNHLQYWKENNERTHYNTSPKDSWMIDGWTFVKGNWS